MSESIDSTIESTRHHLWVSGEGMLERSVPFAVSPLEIPTTDIGKGSKFKGFTLEGVVGVLTDNEARRRRYT